MQSSSVWCPQLVFPALLEVKPTSKGWFLPPASVWMLEPMGRAEGAPLSQPTWPLTLRSLFLGRCR